MQTGNVFPGRDLPILTRIHGVAEVLRYGACAVARLGSDRTIGPTRFPHEKAGLSVIARSRARAILQRAIAETVDQGACARAARNGCLHMSGKQLEPWTGDQLQCRETVQSEIVSLIPVNVLHVAVNEGRAERPGEQTLCAQRWTRECRSCTLG
jgi:hypothetical protein